MDNQCYYCGKNFESRIKLYEHVSTHSFSIKQPESNSEQIARDEEQKIIKSDESKQKEETIPKNESISAVVTEKQPDSQQNIEKLLDEFSETKDQILKDLKRIQEIQKKKESK